MNMSVDRVKDYYEQITGVDVGEVARDLLDGRITNESPLVLECDCPNHQSQSKRSLHILLDRQAWYCHACRIGGDVLHLVEFLLSGTVTTGKTGPMPESHKEARDFLAKWAGLPKLSEFGVSPEELVAIEEKRKKDERCFEVLTHLTEFYHQKLMNSPEVLDWFRTKYGIQTEMIERLKIGFADHKGWTQSQGSSFSREELLSTGAFLGAGSPKLFPFFKKRVVFPYWSRGRVTNLIGRRTPWTPENEYEQGKYKKLLVHDPKKRPHIANCINNRALFNEDCLLRNPSRVIITEGVTDCISLIEQGFEAVSPVTVRIRKVDWERLIPSLKNIPVYICLDNEVSGVGISAAVDMASAMNREGLQAKLVELPLSLAQVEARAKLKELLRLPPEANESALQAAVPNIEDKDKKQVDQLLAQSKIDVNGFFLSGKTASDFEQLVKDAKTPLEFRISSLPETVPEADLPEVLAPILEGIADLEPIFRNRFLKMVQDRLGKNQLPMAVLRAQFRAAARQKEDREKAEKKRLKRKVTSKAGTCKAAIEAAMIAMEDTGDIDMIRIAEVAFDWFVANGARFYFSTTHDPILYFSGNTYLMDSPERGERRKYHAMMLEHTAMVTTSSRGRTFFDVLASLALKYGKRRDHFSWLHSVPINHTVYFNLNNEDQEIVKISPDGVEVMKNGGNPDEVILVGNPKLKPITFIPDADLDRAEKLTQELIYKNLTCAPRDRYFVLAWLSCFLLIDFAGTRPMTRFEGSQGSGKTMASKLISTLLYGDPQQKMSTEAALYSDGTQNPLVLLDNIEVKNVTEGLISFLLTCITGIAKEKRSSGSDLGTVLERPNCLVNTTGIEPLGGELTEILSRTFTVIFDANEAREVFLETEVLNQIRHHRDYILSALMKRTSIALAMMVDGGQAQVMALLQDRLGTHSKKRCNDYLSLMYLMTFAGEPEERVDQALSELSPEFAACIESMNQTTLETAVAANPTATCLSVLFNAYRQALESDEENLGLTVTRTFASAFKERYQIQFQSESCIKDVKASVLFAALKRVAREFDLSFPMTSVKQFGRRINNDRDVIFSAGFDIQTYEGRARTRYYTVVQEIL